MSQGCSHLDQDEPPRPSVDHHAAGGAPSRWRRSVPRRTDGCPQGHFGAERGL